MRESEREGNRQTVCLSVCSLLSRSLSHSLPIRRRFAGIELAALKLTARYKSLAYPLSHGVPTLVPWLPALLTQLRHHISRTLTLTLIRDFLRVLRWCVAGVVVVCCRCGGGGGGSSGGGGNNSD